MKTKDYFGSNWKELTFTIGEGAAYVEVEVVYKDESRRDEAAKAIHESLRGNKSYINSDIELNIDEPNIIRLLVTEDADDIPPKLLKEIKNKICILEKPET